MAGLVAAAAQPAPAGVDGAKLHVIPFPGTPDAAPASRVIFLSLVPSDLGRVRVVGSRTGLHAGRVVKLPARAGAAFVPTRPFARGEVVRVRAALTSAAAGTASGAPGATALRFTFTVARAPTHSVPLTAGPPPVTKWSADHTQSFHSRSDLHPPVVVATGDPDNASGDMFLTPNHTRQRGLMILNPRGRLVWFRPVTGSRSAFNLEVQRYQGQPVLTWWQGIYSSPNDQPVNGKDMIVDQAYRTVAVLHAGNGYVADPHEFQLTPQATALIDSYVPVRADLSTVGGSSQGTVLDCVIQEMDVRTGQVLWEWHALGHVPLRASYKPPPAEDPYDYFHLNSVQRLPGGNLVISARNTWAVYEISRQTGNVIWTLGGKHSSFKMGPRTGFEWQHDAHLYGRTVTVFDDGALPQRERQSSAKQIRIDPRTMSAALVRRYIHSPALLAGSQGNVQTLPGGRLFVGWGSEPNFSEYTARGRQIFDARFPLGVLSYRAYRFPWSGLPHTNPSVSLGRRRRGGVTVYASWNGATGVAAWRVLGMTGAGRLESRRAARRGFETQIGLDPRPKSGVVQALDATGHVLGSSVLPSRSR
ncbi:MAG: arylsulfotransferase family protein [Solirubrobacteraceae bacterium]